MLIGYVDEQNTQNKMNSVIHLATHGVSLVQELIQSKKYSTPALEKNV